MRIKVIKALALFILTASARSVFPEVTLSGQADVGLAALPVLPYEENRFYNVLNPGNYQELRDVNLSTDFLARLESEDDVADFSFWMALKPYEIGTALLTAAYDPSGSGVAQALLYDSLPLLGSRFDRIDVLRANIGLYIEDFLILRLGRQSMLTGYGYGWNPIDFFNPLKDPYDPDQELRGVDAFTAQLYLGYEFTARIFGIYRTEELADGVDFENLQAGTEITVALPQVELKLTGLYDYDDLEGEDPYVPALGLGLKLDLAGLGVYGEAGLMKGSRRYFPVTVTSLARKDDWLFSTLLGVEYTFEPGISIILEYFFNGEGYDLEERRLYRDSLDEAGIPTSDLILMYKPGYFANHYILFNFFLPLYDLYTDIEFSCLYSPDSWALNLLPSLTFNISGHLSVNLYHVWLISLNNDQYNEAWFSPARHTIMLEAQYIF